jgi:hypothetical protein
MIRIIELEWWLAVTVWLLTYLRARDSLSFAGKKVNASDIYPEAQT